VGRGADVLTGDDGLAQADVVAQSRDDGFAAGGVANDLLELADVDVALLARPTEDAGGDLGGAKKIACVLDRCGLFGRGVALPGQEALRCEVRLEVRALRGAEGSRKSLLTGRQSARSNGSTPRDEQIRAAAWREQPAMLTIEAMALLLVAEVAVWLRGWSLMSSASG